MNVERVQVLPEGVVGFQPGPGAHGFGVVAVQVEHGVEEWHGVHLWVLDSPRGRRGSLGNTGAAAPAYRHCSPLGAVTPLLLPAPPSAW